MSLSHYTDSHTRLPNAVLQTVVQRKGRRVQKKKGEENLKNIYMFMECTSKLTC